MNKSDIVSNISTKSGISKNDTTTIIDGFLNEVTQHLALGEPVSLIGFGKFEVRNRAARKGRNPQSGQEIDIAASIVPAFKPAKGLKDSVNV